MPYNHEAEKESMFCDRPCCMAYHSGPCADALEDDDEDYDLGGEG